MNIIVQKFGGSSVKDSSLRRLVIGHIINIIKQEKIPVIVVSAMGDCGQPYSTDKLIDLIKKENEEVSKREIDQVMSCGEIIASAVLASGIQGRGYQAVSLTGQQAGIRTDGTYGKSEIVDIDTSLINNYIEQGVVVVVAGFQGVSPGGDITTLGRGGSDTTAAALGAYLGADRIELYTDVDGLMTADPKLVPQAEPIEEITFQEIFLMANEGAKIVHPRAVDFAMKNEIPLIIKKTESGKGGTKVVSNKPVKDNRMNITGIIHSCSLVQVIVPMNDLHSQTEKITIFDALNKTNIDPEMFDILEDRLIFVINGDDFTLVMNELEKRGLEDTSFRNNCAKITLLYSEQRKKNYMAFQALQVLSRENITLYQTADSNIGTSFLLSQDELKKAVNLLHEYYYSEAIK